MHPLTDSTRGFCKQGVRGSSPLGSTATAGESDTLFVRLTCCFGYAVASNPGWGSGPTQLARRAREPRLLWGVPLAPPQVSIPAPSSKRTVGREDSVGPAGCVRGVAGRILRVFVVVDPDASVVSASP